tara:strand:+ start:48519 stop:48974 length:456 start_codon:yes stop_codon:yes gene_type:complete
MRYIKIKMFGRYSVSSVFFLLSVICFLVVAGFFVGTMFLDLLKAFTGLKSLTSIILFYFPKVIFFYLLILIFRSFKSEKIFTKETINYLHFFTVVNFIMALLIIISINFENSWGEDIIPIFPFIILGVFSAFIAAIFKQGFQIQQENDLTI